MNIIEGQPNVIDLHRQLYSGLLSDYSQNTNKYVPHMTVGRIRGWRVRQEILQELRGLHIVCEALIHELVIEHIDKNSFGKVEARVQLGHH